ncbi:MAG: hypothetical protein WC389_16750 [Lutibacter sp.]|jgi:hypothetical protein
MKGIKISPDMQLEIFENVLLHLIEYPSTRWKLKNMIDSRDNVDQAELDLKLRKLELEIIKQKGEETCL